MELTIAIFGSISLGNYVVLNEVTNIIDALIKQLRSQKQKDFVMPTKITITPLFGADCCGCTTISIVAHQEEKRLFPKKLMEKIKESLEISPKLHLYSIKLSKQNIFPVILDINP